MKTSSSSWAPTASPSSLRCRLRPSAQLRGMRFTKAAYPALIPPVSLVCHSVVLVPEQSLKAKENWILN